MKSWPWPSVAMLWILLSTPAWAETFSADHEHFRYSGRIGQPGTPSPMLTWPGNAVTLSFTGSSLSVRLADRKGENWVSVFIDGDTTQPVVLDLQPGEHLYPVAEGLPVGEHTAVIYRRTEGWEGPIRFLGIELEPGGQMVAPAPAPSRRIEFYGDSITSGMAVDAGIYGGDQDPADKNHFHSYAAIAARALDAEAHTISLSGIGLMVSGFAFAMPRYHQQTLGNGPNTSRWDFTRYRPDVVVINLGQNDKWNLNRLKPVPDASAIVQAYVNFMVTLQGHHPDAWFILAIGSMDASAPDSPWPGYIEQAVEQFRRDHGGQAAHVVFEFTGYRKHPRLEQQQANAEALVAVIRENVGW